MARDHVNRRLGLVAVDRGREVGILVMTPHRAQDDLGEAGPQIRVDVNLWKSSEALKIHAETRGEAASVEAPVADVERPSKVEHDALDLSAGPERFDHLFVCQCG